MPTETCTQPAPGDPVLLILHTFKYEDMTIASRRKFLRNGFAGTTGLLVAGNLPVSGMTVPREKEFNILDYGARADGKTLNTEAIQKAIDACTAGGGGRVVVPEGTFLTGALVIKTGVELHLSEGAMILGSPYMKDYVEYWPLSEVRYSNYLRYALVFAQGARDISVTGTGTLNGNSEKGGELGEFAGPGGELLHVHQRPCLLWFDECENILIKEITYKNAAGWTETYSRCRNIHVDGIKVTENYFFNADGCNMLDCDYFIIENCDINTLDDGICLKGYTQEGVRHGIIRNNRVRSICNGIKMGTDSSGGFRDILIENNHVWQTAISGIALEITDGGVMENVTVRNITMDVVGTPIFVMLSNRNRSVFGELTVPSGAIRNVYIGNIKATVDRAQRFNDMERRHFMNLIVHTSSITGFPENDVEKITIENVDITVLGGFPEQGAEASLRPIPEAGRNYPENRMFGILPSYGFYIRHVRDLQMRNIRVAIEQEDGRPAFMLDDVKDSVFEDVSVESLTPTPAFALMPNCKGITADLDTAGAITADQ